MKILIDFLIMNKLFNKYWQLIQEEGNMTENNNNHYESTFSLKRFLIAVGALVLILLYAIFFMD